MILKILSIKPGAYDQFEEKILDFWITGELQSGKIIQIFDYNYDLRDLIGNRVECLIFTPLASISKQRSGRMEKNVISGYIINSHKIDKKWQIVYDKEHDIYDMEKDYIAIKTADGIFPTNLTEKDIKEIDTEKDVYFKIGRYDLIAYIPIE